MVAKAEGKRLYDELAVGDLVEWLAARPDGSADLALAADVLVYLGDLRPVFAAVARVLGPGALFAFTVQAGEGEDVTLGEDLRFAHSEPHLRRLAAECDLSVLLLESGSTRENRGVSAPGLIAAFARA
jgi:predicted TPR repeat methyltransferase